MRKKKDTVALPNVVNVFEEILSALPPNCVKLETERQPGGEVFAKLTPSNPFAAKIVARGGAGLGYDLMVGEATLFEIMPSGRTLGNRSAVEELRAICSAVIAGDFEETVYTAGKKVAKTISKLTIDGKTTKTRQWYEFYPFVPKKKRVIKYLPYY